MGHLLLKARTRVRQVFGTDPSTMYVPWKTTELLATWTLESIPFAIATMGIPLSVHYPSHPLFKTTLLIQERPKLSHIPITDTVTIFTDTSGQTSQYGCA